MAEPSREDAQLMVQLAQWGTSLGVPDAMTQVLSEDFDPYEADANDPQVQKILMYAETIGTLVKRDLISKELVEDWLWIDGLWARVGPAAVKHREKFEEQRLYENFEAMTSDNAPDVEAALREAEQKKEEAERKRKEEEERKEKEEEERKKKEEEEAKAKEEQEGESSSESEDEDKDDDEDKDKDKEKKDDEDEDS